MHVHIATCDPMGWLRKGHQLQSLIPTSRTMFLDASWTLQVAHILNLPMAELARGVGQFVASCQTYEGGIGGEPGNEAHGGYAVLFPCSPVSPPPPVTEYRPLLWPSPVALSCAQRDAVLFHPFLPPRGTEYCRSSLSSRLICTDDSGFMVWSSERMSEVGGLLCSALFCPRCTAGTPSVDWRR